MLPEKQEKKKKKRHEHCFRKIQPSSLLCQFFQQLGCCRGSTNPSMKHFSASHIDFLQLFEIPTALLDAAFVICFWNILTRHITA
jgi:hypothetical protein